MAARVSSIALILHHRQKLSFGAVLRRIVDDVWRPEGRTVIAMPPVPGHAARAEAAFVHVDLTHVPPVFAETAAPYGIRVNAGVRDISKRTICTSLVAADDDYDGPVIVKTDFNHLGFAEQQLGERLPDWRWIFADTGYRTFGRKRDVPARVWREPGLVVQRLHVERFGDSYFLRQWFFFGDRDLVSIYRGSEPVVKQANVVERLPFTDEVPDALRARRAELGFDYGKFDYVIEDGRAVLLDANATPNNGTRIGSERSRIICETLAPGIDDLAR